MVIHLAPGISGGAPLDSVSYSAVRDFLASARWYHWRIILTLLCVATGGIYLASGIQADYAAHSAMIVTLGPEYTASTDAGQAVGTSQMLVQREILKTESGIISSSDLHRRVIAAIGIKTLYPNMYGPPSMMTQIRTEIRRLLNGDTDPRSNDDIIAENALLEFNTHFAVESDRDSNVMNLAFRHPNAVMASRVLKTLMTLYLELRRDLYAQQQSGIVANEATRLRAVADKADAQLLAFRRDNNLSSLTLRRETLMKAQGDAEQDIANNKATVVQGNAKVKAMLQLLTQIPMTIPADETTMDVRMQPLMINTDALRVKLDQALTKYSEDSPVVADLRRQLAIRENYLRELARTKIPSTTRMIQNPLWVNASTSLIVAQDDLKGAEARQATAQDRLDRVLILLRELQIPELELSRLERTYQAATDDFVAANKTLAERRMFDNVQARKEDTVRVLEDSMVPGKRQNTRFLVAVASLFAASLMATIVALVSHYFRRTYVSGFEVERDLGVAVLAEVGHGRHRLLQNGVI